MKYPSIAIVSVVIAALCAPAAAAPTTKPKAKGPEPLPVMADIQQKFDDGEYAETLKMIARALPAKGAPAAGYDRYELLTMRGESQLRLKQIKSAMESFGVAATATTDPRDAATARATQRTLREAKDNRIQRRFASKEGPTSADILDPKQREAAMRIVYDDLRQTIEPKVKEARRARELPPIAEAFKMLGELQDFEVVLTGLEDNQRIARDELGVRARDLISKELDRMQKDLAKIYELADQIVAERITDSSSGRAPYGQPRRPTRDRDEGRSGSETITTYRRGIPKATRAELETMIDTCRKIVPTLDSLGRSTTSVTTEDVDDLVRRTKEIATGAHRALNTRF